MLMDITLIIVGMLIITFSALEGFARALMQLIIFYVITLILGMVLISVTITQDLAQRIATIAGGMPNQTLFTALFFLALLIPSTLGIFLLTHATLENMKFNKLEWLDTVLAVLVGFIFALVFMSLLSNTWGLIVSTVWSPQNAWMTFRTAYASSAMRVFLQRVFAVYRGFLFPFRMTRYPLVYTVIP
ncbi:MAG: hypothetical protein P1S60_13035 [Anaerolineae bacterium]|nr:hypothetical protein [Anaerolineae bacterium]